MAPTVITDLPVEMLTSIFKCLPLEDTFKVRLVCKLFEGAVNEFAFSEMHLLYQPKSFEDMKNICENQELGRHVQKLRFHAPVTFIEIDQRRFELLLKLPESTGKFCHIRHNSYSSPAPEYCTPRCHYTKKELMSQWKKYHMMWKSTQDFIIDPKKPFDILASCMSKLPQLQELWVLTGDAFISKLTKNFLAPEDHGMGAQLSRTEACKLFHPQFIKQSLHSMRQATNVLKAMRQLPINLFIDTVYWSHFEPAISFDAFLPQNCLRLKSLHLHISDFCDFEIKDLWSTRVLFMNSMATQEHAERRQRHLGEVLARLDSLENLELHFRHLAEVYPTIRFDTFVDLSNIFGDTTFKKLNRLSLHTGDITKSSHFADFVARHSSTLKTLEIDNFLFRPPPWMDFIEKVKESTKLDAFSFGGNRLLSVQIALGARNWSFVIHRVYDTSKEDRMSSLQANIENFVLGDGCRPRDPYERLQIPESADETAWNGKALISKTHPNVCHLPRGDGTRCDGNIIAVARISKQDAMAAHRHPDLWHLEKCFTCLKVQIVKREEADFRIYHDFDGTNDITEFEQAYYHHHLGNE